MKAWECSACGGKSFTRLDATTIVCDYCETRFTVEDSEQTASAQLRRAKAAALIAQANQLHADNQLQEEANVLLQALELDEQNMDAWTQLGRAYRQLGLNDDALRCYERALALNPNNGVIYGNVGMAFQAKGDYVSAVQYLKQGLSLVSRSSADYAVIMGNLALSTFKSGNTAEGVRLIDEAERLGYANAHLVRLQMGLVHAPTEAEKQQALSLMQQADQLYSANKYAEAIPLLQRAVKLHEANADAWTKLGRVHRLTGNPNEAMRCYQRALDFDPNNGSAYGNIGVLHHQRGEYEQAIQHFSKALGMLPTGSPDRATMTANLASATYLSGDHANGERLLKNAENLGYRNGDAVRQQLGIKKKTGLRGLFK